MKLQTWRFLAVGLLAVAAAPARADFIPAIDFSSGRKGNGNETGTTIVVGYSFTTGSIPLVTDALGLWSGTNPAYLRDTVRLYQDGTTTNLASAVVTNTPVSSPTPHGNTYNYTEITPVTLQANTTYDIVADLAVGDSFIDAATPVVNNSDITYTKAVSSVPAYGFGSDYPTSDNLAGVSSDYGPYFGPAFEITPEPSAFLLSAVGVLTVLGWSSKKLGGATSSYNSRSHQSSMMRSE